MGGGGPIQAGTRRTPYARNTTRSTLSAAPTSNTSINTVAASMRGSGRRSTPTVTNERRNTDEDAEHDSEVNYKTYEVLVVEKVIANNIRAAT